VQGAVHLLRLQVLVHDNGCRGRRLHRHIEFWHVEVVRRGWCGGHVEFWHGRDFEFWHVHLGSATNVGMWGTSNFGIENDGLSTLGMSNLGSASGTLNSGTDDDNDAVGLGGGCAGTWNVGGEGTSVLGMPSFSIEKNGMSGTLMSGTGKTTASSTTLTSLGWMWRRTTVRRQQCPILALTLAPSLALPIAAAAIAHCRSQGRGWPEDVIAAAKTPSPPPPTGFHPSWSSLCRLGFFLV